MNHYSSIRKSGDAYLAMQIVTVVISSLLWESPKNSFLKYFLLKCVNIIGIMGFFRKGK